MDPLDWLVRLALHEDLGHGDVTSETVVDPETTGEALVFGREPFVLSGSKPFRKVFYFMDPAIQVSGLVEDGTRVEANREVFRIKGRLQSILKAERTALNFLQRLCGIATLTRQMVDALGGKPCKVLDTRKTTPLWRAFEKEAVRHGGGVNHRFGLYDGILIKDNHVAACGGVRQAVQKAREGAPHMLKIEVEVENLKDLREAIEAGADIVLLDNFSLDGLREAVRAAAGRCLLEASGGVTLDRIRAIAETGVDLISCGALTHSAKAIDLTMEIAPSKTPPS